MGDAAIEVPQTPADEPQDDGNRGLSAAAIRALVRALSEGDATQVRAFVAPLKAVELADVLEIIPSEPRRTLVEVVRPDLDPEVLTYLDDPVRAEVLEQIGPRDVAAALANLETDDALLLVEDLDEDQRSAVLDALPFRERIAVQEGLSYPEESAGRLMQRALIAIPEFWTVGQTIDYTRESDELPEAFYELFIVDAAHKPIGTLPLYRLMRTKRPVAVGSIMDADITIISATTDQEEVAYLFRQYDLVSAPVVDGDGRLIGVITFDDVADVISDEAEEDIMRMGGVIEGDLYHAALRTTRNRFVWLVVNLATAVLASAVISLFDATIEQMVALAVLMPIVASMGGQAGTQTLTVAVRAIATRELTAANSVRILRKEVLVGGFNGILFAAICGAIAALWFASAPLGAVLAAAMVVNMVMAGLSGIVIPLMLVRLKLDPAIAAGVLLTTVTDVVGFFAFLGLASVLLI